jgi:hypothetical protein
LRKIKRDAWCDPHRNYVGEGYPPSPLFLQKDEDTTCRAPLGVHQGKNVTCCWSKRCDILIEQSQFCLDKRGPVQDNSNGVSNSVRRCLGMHITRNLVNACFIRKLEFWPMKANKSL